MGKQRILVVEDDAAIRRGIVQSLKFNGYEVLEAEDLRSALSHLEQDFDLLLLDLMLPDGDGLEVLQKLRARSRQTSVIVLTARGEEADRVRGLKLGADDYVVKPFGALELLARIEAVLRRSVERPAPPNTLALPCGVLDLGKREVAFHQGGSVSLSEREADLLAYLARHPGETISRDEILARVWKLNPDAVETRTVDMFIVRLREKSFRIPGSSPRCGDGATSSQTRARHDPRPAPVEPLCLLRAPGAGSHGRRHLAAAFHGEG